MMWTPLRSHWKSPAAALVVGALCLGLAAGRASAQGSTPPGSGQQPTPPGDGQPQDPGLGQPVPGMPGARLQVPGGSQASARQFRQQHRWSNPYYGNVGGRNGQGNRRNRNGNNNFNP